MTRSEELSQAKRLEEPRAWGGIKEGRDGEGRGQAIEKRS